MSRYGTGKSYGRRGMDTKSSLKFDQLLSENTNKPSTAKVSVAGGQRWGMASFTSVRKSHANGGKDPSSISKQDDSLKRMKMGKGDNADDDPFSFDCDGSSIKTRKVTETFYPSVGDVDSVQKTTFATKPNKFFKSSSASRSRPLSVQNTINKEKLAANANLYYDKNNSNSFATKPLVKNPGETPYNDLNSGLVKQTAKISEVPKVTVNLAVSPFVIEDKTFPKPEPTIYSNKRCVNDPFDLLLNSAAPVQKTEFQSFSVARILSEDNKFTSNGTPLNPQSSSADNFYTPPSSQNFSSQNDIFSIPSSQYSTSSFAAEMPETPESELFDSQPQHFSSNFSYDSVSGEDLHYRESSLPKTYVAYENDFSTVSTPNKNYREPEVKSNAQISEATAQPQIFNPAFRTYARNKPQSEESSANATYSGSASDSCSISGGANESSSTSGSANPSYSNSVNTKSSYSNSVTAKTSYSSSVNVKPSYSNSGNGNQSYSNSLSSSQSYSNSGTSYLNSGNTNQNHSNSKEVLNHYDPGASCSTNVIKETESFEFSVNAVTSENMRDPLLHNNVSNISDSQFSVLSDSAPTDCSQDSKESSQPDAAEGIPKNERVIKATIVKQKKIFSTPKKNKASYNPRSGWQVQNEDHSEEAATTMEVGKMSLADEFDEDEELNDREEDDDDFVETQKLTLSKYVKKTTNQGEVITSWKCQRSVKGLYTVVHNVKQAHQCHESGETQEFNDDVDYLLEGIQVTVSAGTRCLSVLSWATKCMSPSFRIHLRAHGHLSKVFSALTDAPNDPCLSLSTATLMFVLSQDRLTMDLDKSTLKLLLELLECDSGENLSQSSTNDLSLSINSQQSDKIREKVRSLCEEMKQKGYANQLDLNNITTGILAMETFLSLSSRRTGEWFKEEIRNLNGLDYLVENVFTGCQQWKEDISDISCLPSTLDRLRKLDRCLRVIENATYSNKENQKHVLTEIGDDKLVLSCIRLLQLCRTSIVYYPIDATGDNLRLKSSGAPGAIIFATVKTLLKVLINVTHENGLGSACVGSQEGILECILLLILQTCAYIPPEERFDLQVLSFALLINFVEFCPENRERLVRVSVVGSYDLPTNGEEMSCVDALIEVFVNRLRLAKQSEDQASALLDGQAEGNGDIDQTQIDGPSVSTQVISTQAQVEQLEETLMKALHKAGKNMEHTIIASYISLLIGCIIENPEYREMVGGKMPNESFTPMIEVLRKFLNFVNLTGVVSNAGLKSIRRVLEVLESS